MRLLPRKGATLLLLACGAGALASCTAILGIGDSLPDATDASTDAPAPRPDGVAPGVDAMAYADASADVVGISVTTTVTPDDSVLGISPLDVLQGANLRFGEALAFSPDGTWLAIGAPGAGRADSDAGATGEVQLVNILVQDGGGTLTRTLLDRGQARPTPVANGSFGRSVAFSPDGLYLAVGAPEEPNSEVSGQVYLYAREGDHWVFQASIGPTAGMADSFGNTVAFNAPAQPSSPDILFVAATGDATLGDAGTSMTPASVSAYSFGDGGLSNAAAATLKTTQAHDGFGWCIASSASGDVVLIGAPFASLGGSTQDGYVYVASVASFPTFSVTDLVNRVTHGGPDLFGYSVAFFPSGSLALIGTPNFNDGGGQVTVWSVDAAAPPSFAPVALNFLYDRSATDAGGTGVSVAADENGALVGEPGGGGGGGTCLTSLVPSSSNELSPLADQPDAQAGARYGTALATIVDGGWVAVAAPGTDGTPPPVVYLQR